MAYTAIPPVSTGGGGGTSSAPISGDGSGGNPFTIAAGSIGLGLLATQATQTVLGNGSGGAASPVALDISGATSGLIATATVLSNKVFVGNNAATTTWVGGTLTTQGLLIQANAADLTTGNVNFRGATFQVGSVAPPFGTVPWTFGGSALANMSLAVINSSTNLASHASLVLGVASATLTGPALVQQLYSPNFVTSGNITGGTLVFDLSTGTGNVLHRLRQNTGIFVWETTTSNTERMRITNAGDIQFFGVPSITSCYFSNGTAANNQAQLIMGAASSNANSYILQVDTNQNGQMAGLWARNQSTGSGCAIGVTLEANGTGSYLRLLGTNFTVAGNLIGSSLHLHSGGGNLVLRAAAAAGNMALETGGANERLRISSTGNVSISTGLTTTAQDGFLYVPSCAGVPTGVPTTINSGATIPMCADRTNNKLYIYSGGAWVILN